MASKGTVKDWNFFKNRVETDINNNEYVGGHSVLIAAGPPKLSQMTVQPEDGSPIDPTTTGEENDNDVAYPIGLVQNVTMQQGREVARLFEVGSKRSYFIPGRSTGSVSLSRVVFDGRSLLRVLSAYYKVKKSGGSSGSDDSDEPFAKSLTKEQGDRISVAGDPQTANVREKPGSNEKFFIDIASDLFDRPVGLLFYIKNNNAEPYGQFYLENCFLQNHQFQVGAGSTVMSESVSVQYDNLAPITIGNIAPQGDIDDPGVGGGDVSQNQLNPGA